MELLHFSCIHDLPVTLRVTFAQVLGRPVEQARRLHCLRGLRRDDAWQSDLRSVSSGHLAAPPLAARLSPRQSSASAAVHRGGSHQRLQCCRLGSDIAHGLQLHHGVCACTYAHMRTYTCALFYMYLLFNGISVVAWIVYFFPTMYFYQACSMMLFFKNTDPFHYGSLGRAMFTGEFIEGQYQKTFCARALHR